MKRPASILCAIALLALDLAILLACVAVIVYAFAGFFDLI